MACLLSVQPCGRGPLPSDMLTPSGQSHVRLPRRHDHHDMRKRNGNLSLVLEGWAVRTPDGAVAEACAKTPEDRDELGLLDALEQELILKTTKVWRTCPSKLLLSTSMRRSSGGSCRRRGREGGTRACRETLPRFRGVHLPAESSTSSRSGSGRSSRQGRLSRPLVRTELLHVTAHRQHEVL